MERITYTDLVSRYGNTAAFSLLLTIEKLARIRNDIIKFDEDERLKNALDALDQVDLKETAANNN